MDDYPVTFKMSPHMIITEEHAINLELNPLILIKTRSTKKLQAILDFLKERLKINETLDLELKYKD
jgi:hypothetical protein